MSPNFKRNLLVWLCCVCLHLWPVCAGAAYHVVPARWQQLTNDKAFAYRHDVEKAQQQKIEQDNAFLKFINAIIRFFTNGGGYILLWLLAAALLIWILYKVFISKDVFLFSRKQKVFAGEASATDTEDINSDWALLAQQASAGNDLRLAVRYNYMWLLQLLQKQELIQYRSDKTNFEYAAELAGTAYRQPFSKLSRQYEYTWYGHYVPSEEAYNQYTAMLYDLKTTLDA